MKCKERYTCDLCGESLCREHLRCADTVPPIATCWKCLKRLPDNAALPTALTERALLSSVFADLRQLTKTIGLGSKSA